MNKADQVIWSFRDVYNKMVFLNKFRMEQRLKEYTSSEVHCIVSVAENADPNVTKLAESFYMTRGAISKITQKLMAKGVLESYRKAENKKEIYFRLTEKGRTVYTIHEQLHTEFLERDKAIIGQFTEEQYDMMLGFVEKYGRHLDEEIKKQGLDIKDAADCE